MNNTINLPPYADLARQHRRAIAYMNRNKNLYSFSTMKGQPCRIYMEMLSEVIATEFSRIIRRDLTEEQLKTVRNLNRRYKPDLCATHDFLDANMSMDEAFRNLLGDNIEPGRTSLNRWLWSEAWRQAKQSEFTLEHK